MSYVEPISDKRHIEKAGEYIRQTFDSAYYLIWAIGINTGYRITDICELKYSDFDFDRNEVRIAENKGTRSALSRARAKAVREISDELQQIITLNRDSSAMDKLSKLLAAKTTDDIEKVIYSVVDKGQAVVIKERINKAIAGAKPKYRTAAIPKWLVNLVNKRKSEFSGTDSGSLFARATIKSNRASGRGVITRQSCWRIFSKITDFIKTLGGSIRVACHSLRKTYCRGLYYNNNNDISLLMTMVGHSSPEMSLRYIGVTQDKERQAAANVHNEFKPSWVH